MHRVGAAMLKPVRLLGLAGFSPSPIFLAAQPDIRKWRERVVPLTKDIVGKKRDVLLLVNVNGTPPVQSQTGYACEVWDFEKNCTNS
jgi:hypothetical protein